MSYQQQQQEYGKDCGCHEIESPTQKKTINRLRQDYCKEMYFLEGEVEQLQVRQEQLGTLIKEKQCWFVWTEQNYRIHRNLELMIGSELIQTSDSIKDGVKNYLTSNKMLADALKKFTASVKDVRDKMKDFRDAECKLENCKDDPCSCNEMIELTGVVPPNCQGKPQDRGGKPRPPSACSADTINKLLDWLFCMPKNLYFDVESLYKSASNTQGIQTFSNIASLDSLQNELVDRIKKFDKQITDNIKRGEADVKSSLDDLTKSRKELAKTDVDLYAKRTDFEGVKDAVKFYCCEACHCVEDEKGDCNKRLHECECKICEICGKVQKAHCGDDEPQKQAATAR